MRKKIDSKELKEILTNTFKVINNKYIDIFRKLDAEIGDGDLGITIFKSNNAMIKKLEELDTEDIGVALIKCGVGCMEANPSTFGMLLATAFMEGGKAVKGKTEINLSDIRSIFEAAEKGIMKRGKVNLGEKTMLDALHPVVEVLKKASNEKLSIEEAAELSQREAEEGMNNTREMIATKGRAKAFAERTVGELDPGATVIFYFFKEINNSLK
ncbi:MAG: phosphoenolpyruvate---glycerone phosphotransferase subunit DhaL [Kosmotogales bacterium]|nr:phosphoenolpyruvate---glycerone phosphotransferase subunit DhaL [Kosmotogales bacterium]